MLNMKYFLQPITGSLRGDLTCMGCLHLYRLFPLLTVRACSIHDALIELSRRSENREHKPVVKLIFDRGNPKQIIKNHQRVAEAEWADLGLPTKEELKFINFEVMVSRSLPRTFESHFNIVLMLQELSPPHRRDFPRQIHDHRPPYCLYQL